MTNKLVWAITLILAVCFISICVFSASRPMRMEYDVTHYVPMADAIEAGKPFQEKDQQWPIGYPLVIIALRHLGCGGNLGLIITNIVGLALGLTAFAGIARKALGMSWLAIACVLSYTLVSGAIRLWRVKSAFWGVFRETPARELAG